MPPDMPAAKLRPDRAKHADDAARHIFAAVVAGAFDHCDRSGVADSEALAGNALEISLARNRAVEHGVADDDVLRRVAVGAVRLANDHAPARKALADIIIGVAGQLERHAMRQERAKALPRGALQPDEDAVVRQASWPKRRATSPDSIVPTLRWTLRTSRSMITGSPLSAPSRRRRSGRDRTDVPRP